MENSREFDFVDVSSLKIFHVLLLMQIIHLQYASPATDTFFIKGLNFAIDFYYAD